MAQSSMFAIGLCALLTTMVVTDLARSFMPGGNAVWGWGGTNSTEEATPSPLKADFGRSAGGRLHISYCGSCAYKGAFQRAAQAAREHFTGLEVLGSEYPVAMPKLIAAKVVSAAQYATWGFCLAGEKIFQVLSLPAQPKLFEFVNKQKMQLGIGAWLAGNMAGNALTGTGAFEVYFDGKLIFSKLQTGTMPNGNALLQAIEEEAGEMFSRRKVDAEARRDAGIAAAAEAAEAAEEHLRAAGLQGDI